ncbi:ABC transporter ATP-binding protein [Kibdelosporangium phytohabitans]|uniref:ABC transporter ATP-binding protein n=1 Tax=Kibdelosporangium phytohabitans TaxID=860235 RepID=A0A0N9IJR0_9PSEU|nr:ABC transporter ATP-binding protein [Kibdelosporangium phytohabitans]ALG15362.1 ABC transporter ATP-binding protein [Kibdelosporangium phytohabitans]
MLEVQGLTRRFHHVTVLDAVSFDLHSGRAAALVGPNGSGKTTLLRCVVGADIADDGEVRFDGDRLVESDPRVRAALACALDDADFFPELSVVEHLELLARAHGVSEPGDVVAEVLSDLDLVAQQDQLPITLSSGQRRRFTLGACLVRPRKLLVLDEPEQRLDVAGRAWLAEKLRDEKAEGCAILLASHDQQLVDAVADTRIELG